MRVLLAVLLLLVAAPAAEARWFDFQRIDGPGASRPVVDLGIEEGGGLTYVKSGRAWLSH